MDQLILRKLKSLEKSNVGERFLEEIQSARTDLEWFISEQPNSYAYDARKSAYKTIAEKSIGWWT